MAWYLRSKKRDKKIATAEKEVDKNDKNLSIECYWGGDGVAEESLALDLRLLPLVLDIIGYCLPALDKE